MQTNKLATELANRMAGMSLWISDLNPFDPMIL